MTTIHELSPILQDLLTTTANQIARQSGFIQRQRQVTGAGFAQTLVLGGLLNPDATRKEQHQSAIQTGMSISAQGLEQRFTAQARDFMRQLLEAGLQQLVVSERSGDILSQFKGVYVTDCTRLVWGKTGEKLAVRWELQGGQIQAKLGDLLENDQRSGVIDAPMPKGALHLGDLGFFKVSRFAQWNQQGVFWLSRYKVGTKLFHADGRPFDLCHELKTQTFPLTIPVKVSLAHRVDAYCVIDRISDEAYPKRLARIKEQARLDQKPISPSVQALDKWTIYLTNIPDLTFEQAHTLARTRWQIELLFKLWKSHGAILRSRSNDLIRQQCEGYAKLLGVLIAHWLLLVSGWQHDIFTPLDGLRLVRSMGRSLFEAVRNPKLWVRLSQALARDLMHISSRSKRRKSPLAFQLWAGFDP